MTTDMTTLMANLETLDGQAPEHGVVYDMKKERYLTVNKQGGKGHTTAITQPPYSWAKKHTFRQGFRLLGAQVWPLASHDQMQQRMQPSHTATQQHMGHQTWHW